MSEKRQGDQTTRGANVGVRLGRGGLAAWLVLARPHSLTKPDTTAEWLSLLGTVLEKKRFRVLFLCLCRCGFCRFGFVFWVVFWL